VSSPSANRSCSGVARWIITDARRHDLEQLDARYGQLVLELLRQQLPVVRELSVDASRRQPDAVGCEDDLVLVHANVDVVAATRNASELLQRTAWNDRLELGNGSIELGLLDSEPV